MQLQVLEYLQLVLIVLFCYGLGKSILSNLRSCRATVRFMQRDLVNPFVKPTHIKIEFESTGYVIKKFQNWSLAISGGGMQ